ncbi:MAG: phosphate-starvation-inducible PsiE family protein [Bryobacteraceae bacterium]
MRNSGFSREKLVWMFEKATITALQILIVVAVVVATVMLFVLFVQNLYTRIADIQTVGDLLPAMQKVFAGALIVLLGLELAETLRTYFAKHEIRVEVILIMAIVAIGRHMIQLDFDHVPASEIFGLSALMASLTGGYFFVKRAQSPWRTGDSSVSPEHSDAETRR